MSSKLLGLYQQGDKIIIHLVRLPPPNCLFYFSNTSYQIFKYKQNEKNIYYFHFDCFCVFSFV